MHLAVMHALYAPGCGETWSFLGCVVVFVCFFLQSPFLFLFVFTPWHNSISRALQHKKILM